MWDQIPKHKATIQQGLSILQIKHRIELILFGFLLITLPFGADQEFIGFLTLVAGTSFVCHMLVLKFTGYFKACAFYGLSGHEGHRTITETIGIPNLTSPWDIIWIFNMY